VAKLLGNISAVEIMKSQNVTYLPSIDHLRGLAALLIVFFHGVSWYLNLHLNFGKEIKQRPIAENIFQSLIIEGHTAVALFIVLSGFIFTIGCYKRDIVYTKFLKNRLLRTYPLYIFLIFFGFASYHNNFNLVEFIQILLPFANLTSQPIHEFGKMFWTVAIEWQFYLVFPLLLAIINKHGGKYLLLLIITFVVFRNIAYTMKPDINISNLSYATMAGRMDQFLIGMLIGIFYRESFKAGRLADALFISSLVAIFITLYYFNIYEGLRADTYFKVYWPTIEGILWGGFVLGYLSFSRHTPRLVSTILTSAGIISYSIYLSHFIVIMMVLRLGLMPKFFDTSTFLGATLGTALIILPIALIVATLTYHTIEKPFLEFRVKYKRPSKGPQV
jgi:peptidoglycan/LPS O-acetylase OafA/YrhL